MENKASFQDYLAKMAIIFDELGYRPSPEQWRFHRSHARIRQLAGGVRAGKSFCSARDAVARIVYTSLFVKKQIIWVVGPDYYQPRAEFGYMHDDFLKLGFRVKASMPNGRSSPWTMKVGGVGIVETRTASDPRALASFAPDGIVMAEAAQQPLEIYYKARERLAERRGWLIMSGTFETSLGWYQDFWTKWQGQNDAGARSYSMPTWSNRVIFPGGENDPEIVSLRASTPEDLFMERYGAVPYKPHTLVFREFSSTRHVLERVRYVDGEPVYLAIDPGYDPGRYAVLALQVKLDDKTKKEVVWVVDEMYEKRSTGPLVVRKAKRKRWWKDVVDGVIDVAGRQHQAMRSQVEVWRQDGGVYLRSNPVGVLDGIERHRTFLFDPETGEPRLFHSPKCKNTIREYYSYKRPEDKDGSALRIMPIDRDNHAMKALAYWLYDRYGPVYKRRRKPGRTAVL